MIITTKWRLVIECFFLILITGLPSLASWVQHPLVDSKVSISVAKALKGTPLWVDARTPDNRSQGTIPGAISLTPQAWDMELSGLFEQIQPEQPIVVYCDVGCHSAETVASRIRELGLEPVYVLDGGYQAWERHSKRKRN